MARIMSRGVRRRDAPVRRPSPDGDAEDVTGPGPWPIPRRPSRTASEASRRAARAASSGLKPSARCAASALECVQPDPCAAPSGAARPASR